MVFSLIIQMYKTENKALKGKLKGKNKGNYSHFLWCTMTVHNYLVRKIIVSFIRRISSAALFIFSSRRAVSAFQEVN